MAPSITVIIAGVEHELTEIGRLIAHDGWGMAPQHRMESRGHEQDGATDEGFRLDPRYGDLIFRCNVSTLEDLYARREAALRLFSPVNDPILKFVTHGGKVRHIACHYHSSLTMPWNADDWAAPKLAVTLKCPDPTFFDPVGQAATFAQGSAGDAFEVPTDVPTNIGASDLDAVRSITYEGTWKSRPHLIRVNGPIEDFVIENLTTGHKIQAKSGVTISEGDYYDIDCRFGRATVVDSAGVNKIADLVSSDDLTVFHLAPHPTAAGGVNVIRVTGTGTNEHTRVDMSWQTRDLGV